MAKKNLASLMNGIMGEPKEQETPMTPANTTTPEVTDEMKENLEARRRQNVGRPRKGEQHMKPEEVRATFIVDPSLVRKLKYISLVEGNLLKDVIGKALTTFIESWEADNGKIRLPHKKS
ncbi:MAG: hypothetical protein K2K37_10655 [Muribaculaceae bacterium]|nr:hypothetical protein [Muribaculaceae bacterium]